MYLHYLAPCQTDYKLPKDICKMYSHKIDLIHLPIQMYLWQEFLEVLSKLIVHPNLIWCKLIWTDIWTIKDWNDTHRHLSQYKSFLIGREREASKKIHCFQCVSIDIYLTNHPNSLEIVSKNKKAQTKTIDNMW